MGFRRIITKRSGGIALQPTWDTSKHKKKLNLLLKKSAEAQINFGLGMRFESGQGVPQDYNEAIRWYRLAANLGLIEAQRKTKFTLK